jgi:hypothetical protein
LHTPEQQPTPASPPVHDSPDGRHAVLESIAHVVLLQEREQHSPSWAHVEPATLQIAPPHTLPLHASEQQSCARSQCAPSGAQYVAQIKLLPLGSQRPLQQVLRVLHDVPGDVHAPDGRQ